MKQRNILKICVKQLSTAHNIQFTLRRSSGLAYEKIQSSLRSFVEFFSGTFFTLNEIFLGMSEISVIFLKFCVKIYKKGRAHSLFFSW
jgi:hypothetical protein